MTQRPWATRLKLAVLLTAVLTIAGACERPLKKAGDAGCGAPGETCCDGNACDAGAGAVDGGVTAGPDHDWSQWPAPPDVPTDSEYVVSADGSTVQDTVTGLVWQREVPTNPCPSDGTGTCTWPNARTYCSGLSLGGAATGWRLPTMVELVSLVDLGVFNPAIDTNVFPATPSSGFWTSDAYASEGGGVWIVGFDNGETSGIGTTGSGAVRCVR